MNIPDVAAHDRHGPDPHRPIRRLLFVADAAVAGADEFPPPVRAVIDAAAEVYVVTPSLPGRLAWLTDDVDRFQHVADERLDTVLDHMRSINADASGDALRGSVVAVVTNAVEGVEPDHILLALRSAEHANWQERGLVEHVERRFGLPVTSYAVDPCGRASTAHGSLLLCYDGSADAGHAIERAGALFEGRDAIVMTVWQPTSSLGSFAWAGTTAGMADFAELDQAAAADAGRVAAAGLRIARQSGLEAEPLAVEAAGPIWQSIVETADRHDAAAIVMGSRGLTGVRSMLLGSVSSAVLHHAERPTMVIHDSDDDAAGHPDRSAVRPA
jgi:nucleotide-binding universal stress UspA family protein